MQRVLNQVGLKSLALLISVLSLAQVASATTVIIPADDDLIIGARAIVRGKVISVGSGFDEQHRIFTYITLRVQDVLKGQIGTRKIVIKEEGGQVGEFGSIVFGTPRYAVGEKVLVYLDTWKDGSLRTYQMFLGKFDITQDPSSGREVVTRSAPDENTAVLQQKAHGDHRPGSSTERMELKSYRKMVRARLEANLDRSLRFDEEYYKDVPVLAQPAEYKAIASRGGIEPNFALFPTPFRFFEPDSGQPVIAMVKPTGAPHPETANDMVGAMNAWSNVSGCALRVVSGGLLNECYTVTGLAGIGIVFDNCDGRNSASPGCSGTLAWGGISSAGPQTRVINGTTFRQTIQGFVSFNPWASCHFTVRCNVQEIATHELGHALGLGHSQFSDATMAAFAHFDGRCASIRADDADGIRFIYPGSGGGGPLTIVTTTLPGGTVGTFYSQTLTASGGTPSYSWSLIGGSLPPGLSLNSSGTISGTPSSAGPYNFTVRVTDSASATAQKDLSIAVTSGGAARDSQFVSQTVPTTLNPSQAFSANLKWLNTGTETWTGTAGFRIVSQNPAANVTWGGNTVPLNGFSVATGQQLDLTFTAFAPSTPGTYNFQWQLYKDGVGFFGQMSTNVAIQVGNVGTDNAAFVSQSVPTSMTIGQTTSVSVTMQNTGTTTWAAGTYKLGSQNPQDNTSWGLNRVNLASSVAPGGTATFTFNITAPSTAGTHNFQWRMFRESAGFFGGTSTNVAMPVRFLDVPQSHPFYAEIMNIAQRGITMGCGNGNFCPDEAVSREQMAAFISRALGVFNPPTPASQRFLDVPPSNPFYSFIEEIAVRQITLGCGGGNYCPGSPVTREQMAAFLLRALGEFNPPTPPSQRFLDVPPSNPFYAFIDRLAERGITQGCGGGNYCPTSPVTRGQMAAFLVRAFNL